MQDSYLVMMPIDKLVDIVPLEALLDIVVTETKVAQKRDTLTQKTTVITDTEFEHLTDYNRNIAELLKYTPGQFVNVLSRNDANWGSYAGLGPKYNSYMIDGLAIDSFADGMSLDTWAFERVESQRGPASVLYSGYMTMDFNGNETPLAGTTNFILKENISTSMTRAQIGGGSFGTYGGRVYHQNRNEAVSYFVGGSFETADYTQYGTEASWLQGVKNPEYKKQKIYGRLMVDLGRDDHTLSVFAHHTDHSGDVGRPNREFDHTYNTVNAAYNNQISKNLHLQVKGGYRDYDRMFNNDDYPVSPDWKSRSFTQQQIIPLDMTLTYKHAGNWLLSVGADAQWAHYKTKNFQSTMSTDNEVNAHSTGLFIQEKIQLADWIVRAGARYYTIRHDYKLLGSHEPALDSVSWSEPLWSIGVRYNHTEALAFYANAGTSFMAPAAKQVGGTISNLTDSGQVSNPDLTPESGSGSDFGVEYRSAAGLSAGVRLFYNIINDAIIDNVVSMSPSQTMATNAGESRTFGAEAEIKQSLSDSFEWFANITYATTKVENPHDADVDSSKIPFVPTYVFNVGISTKLPWGIIASPYYQGVGHYYDSTSKSGRVQFGAYQVLNLKLQKNITRNKDYALNVLVDLNNITDNRYEMPWSFIDPGFTGYASIQIVF